MLGNIVTAILVIVGIPLITWWLIKVDEGVNNVANRNSEDSDNAHWRGEL